YDFNRRFTAYVSYASIYNPNESLDRNGNILDPEMGNVYELGLKGEHFNGALYTNLAYFITRQENFAVPDGNLVVPGTTNQAFTTTDGVEVDGYEIELVGLLSDNWELSLGWTDFTAEDQDGEDVVVNHPRKNLKIFTSYNFSDSLGGLKIGGGVNWQSEEPKYAINPVTNVEEHIGENARSVFELMASYKLNDQLTVQANAYNLLDEEYIESSWGTYTYGEPRNFVVSLNYTF
ncbi:MAG TPA: TonB-dependent receptor, partial [Cyclobacteriaceae bacterium]|nr:TonB-dependent receptor [Cyclobacteriaceae bacterium]